MTPRLKMSSQLSSSSPFSMSKVTRYFAFPPSYFILFLLLFPPQCFFLVPGTWAYTYNGSYKISPKPCTVEERTGTCMFVWECLKSEGKHLGMCVDGFMFGSCCGHNSSSNVISDNSPSSSTSTTTISSTTFTSSTTNKYNFGSDPPTTTQHGFQIWFSPTTEPPPPPKRTTSAPTTSRPVSTFRPFSSTHVSRPKPTPSSSIFGSNSNSFSTSTSSSTTSESQLPFVTTNGSSSLPIYEHLPPSAALIGGSNLNHVEATTARERPSTSTEPTITSTTTTEPTTTRSTTTTQRPMTIFIDPLSTTTPQPNIPMDKDYGCGVAPLHPQMRIVGGKAASFAEFPWMVSVRRTSFFGYSSTHRCGGALINENWIATAGHCVDDLLTSQIRIRLGEHDFSRVHEKYPHVERGAAKKVVHPLYNFFTYEHDLALIKLEKPVILTPHISPICLPGNDDLLINENATVSGWGRLSEGGSLPSNLQHVDVPILSNAKCRDLFLKSNRVEHIPDIFICAGHEKGGKDSCQGDSGGPLQVRGADNRWFLAGIISWGIGCAEPNMPGVCTRISKFTSWILKHVTA